MEISESQARQIMTTNQKCRVSFLKINGSVREMLMTMDFSLVPKDKHPKGTGKNTDGGALSSVTVFDLEKNDWRKINMNTLRWVQIIMKNSSSEIMQVKRNK